MPEIRLFRGEAEMNTCSTCVHKLGCYGRIALESLIRDFKLLALDKKEQAECGCAGNVDGIRAAMAAACVGHIGEGGE